MISDGKRWYLTMIMPPEDLKKGGYPRLVLFKRGQAAPSDIQPHGTSLITVDIPIRVTKEIPLSVWRN
jgi:hypothetical protein